MATVETYLPLYRKYRPQSFADVMGQEAIRQTLGNAIGLGKVAHAYLFCGPRGTGKTSTARIFAKSLNCEQGPTVTPCQTCASCTGITAGNALDVIEFDAASNNKVDDARELIENCQFTPMAGRYKIYIIDEVHMLTSQAFNALLKTLEEPPPNVVFIFATTEAHKVLPTIISRCQRFDFTRITRQDIIKRLAYIAEQEGIQIDVQALDTIARHVRGGMRDAVGLLDQVAVIGRAQPDKVIARDDVAMFIGALEEDILVWMSKAIAERQADILLQQIGELERRGVEPAQMVKELTAHYRHLFFVVSAKRDQRQAVSAEQLDLPDAYFEKLVEQSSLYALEELPQILSRLSSIERNIRNTQQPQLWLEVGLLELAHRHEIQVVQNLSQRLDALEQRLSSGAPVSAPPATAMRQAPANPMPMSPPPVPPVAAQAVPAHVSEQPRPELKLPDAGITPNVAAPAAFAEPLPLHSPTVDTAPARPLPPAAAPTPQPAPAEIPVANEAQALYQRICQQVASATTRDLLVQQTFALSFDGGVNLKIGCASEPILAIVKNPRKFIHLQKAADTVLGQTANIELVLEKNMPKSGGAGALAIPKPDGAARRSAAPASAAVNVPEVQLSGGNTAVAIKPLPVETASLPTVDVPTLSSPQGVVAPLESSAPAFSSAVSSVQAQDEPLREQAVTRPRSESFQGSSSLVAFDDDAPPLEDDEPPMMFDDAFSPAGEAYVATALSPSYLPMGPSSLPEGSVGKQMAETVTTEEMESYQLREARQYTLQLLQGRLLD